MLKKLLATCLCLGSLMTTSAVMAADSDTAAPIIIRFSHVVASETPKGQGALLFQKLVSERLAGKVRVEVYPNSSLFGDADELKALQDNQVQMLAPSMAKFSTLAPALQVYDLPFLFDDQAAVERFQRRPQGRALLESLRPHHMVGLAYWHNGMKELSAIRPLRMPADAQGLNFRIQPSEVLEAQFKAINASSTKLPFAQLRTALQSGSVQGAENPWSNIQSQKLDEVQPYITESNHGLLDYVLVTNPDFWYSIPHGVRSELEAIVDEVTYAVNLEANRINAEARQRIASGGKTQIISLSKSEHEAWRAAMQPVWKQYEGQIGKAVLEAAVRAND